jgi:DNA replication regulator SLD3
LQSSIEATPTRKTSNSDSDSFMKVAGTHTEYAGFLPSSPLHVRRSSALLFNSVPDSAHKSTNLSFDFGNLSTKGGVLETPVKRRSIDFDSGHAHPEISLPALRNDKENDVLDDTKKGKSKENSVIPEQEADIYKDLGWDDVDELT